MTRWFSAMVATLAPGNRYGCGLWNAAPDRGRSRRCGRLLQPRSAPGRAVQPPRSRFPDTGAGLARPAAPDGGTCSPVEPERVAFGAAPNRGCDQLVFDWPADSVRALVLSEIAGAVPRTGAEGGGDFPLHLPEIRAEPPDDAVVPPLSGRELFWLRSSLVFGPGAMRRPSRKRIPLGFGTGASGIPKSRSRRTGHAAGPIMPRTRVSAGRTKRK